MKLHYPAPGAVRSAEFSRLTGGLNLRELGYRLRADQSPCMKNMWWQDGVLQSRDGQVRIDDGTDRGRGWACCRELFHGYAFFHMGSFLWYGQPGETGITLRKLEKEVPGNKGVFFRYCDWLFYKNRGGFVRISAQTGGAEPFQAENMTDLAYVPVVAINARPGTGSGDPYQPENRLSGKKTLWYHPEAGVKRYQLPVAPVDRITEVRVDGKKLNLGADYRVDPEKGTVDFLKAPAVTDLPAPNRVSVTYEKANPEALASVMDCDLAFVAGGDRDICILLAGGRAQPNALFWNANDSLSMNPGYFPMTTFNLVGATNDPVTGFGSQYKDVIVLKAHSLGKLEFRLEQVEGRGTPLFTYTPVNDRVGCDLPDTIQLVENNLVFCNTDQGVHILLSSSAAYENNVACISGNVNGGGKEPREPGAIAGLLYDVRQGGGAVGWDDDSSYWLCANGHAYLWNYAVSRADDPGWFYQTGLEPVGFLAAGDHRLLHLDGQGRVTRFARVFTDYGQGFEKLYQFPVTDFGRTDRLKDVTGVQFAVRSDTESMVEIRYDTDYESRTDCTPIPTWDWTLGRMDLGGRVVGGYNLETPRYARLAARKPGCRHVRHFTMTLRNDRPGQDLAIVSAQIFYRFAGKER